MEDMLLLIIDELRKPQPHHVDVPEAELFSRLIDRLGKGRPDAQDYSKQVLLSCYENVKRDDSARWRSWNVDPKLERRLTRILQIKPRRTASGVATITVITKPWRCASDCLYCPNDVRMPKSYLSDEPACQRAERNFFDPYLQTQDRLRALKQMGHLTDKIEVIVLGGSWCDYPQDYQLWFVHELFRALNDGEAGEDEADRLRQSYLDAGYANEKTEIVQRTQSLQDRVNAGELTYNQAIKELYDFDSEPEVVLMDTLCKLQEINETSKHRMVGFTVETRPDLVTADTLTLMRNLGVTRLQIGIQSLDQRVLKLNRRHTSSTQIRQAFALMRAYGFKIHGHFMQNLMGSTREADVAEYLHFMTDSAYIPDEIKLYPCSLVAGTGLVEHYKDGSWQPYDEQELVELLAENTLNTPPFVRISRMIRDISSHDIMAGSKRTNLRQIVEKRITDQGKRASEIRGREISNHEVIHEDLMLDTIVYETNVSDEYFLQWVTKDYRIAGFLRLSLPKPARAEHLSVSENELPTSINEAMIREVHVYGKVAAISKVGESAQHFGLGKQLVEAACEIAQEKGYDAVNVISSVGTRQYYRKLGFADSNLYQKRKILPRFFN